MRIKHQLTGTVFILLLAATAHCEVTSRSCTVGKLLNTSGYTYILCKEGLNDIWLASTRKKLTVGETILFTDNQPLDNIYCLPLKKTFPRIIFTHVRKDGELPQTSPGSEPTSQRLCDACDLDCSDDYLFADINMDRG